MIICTRIDDRLIHGQVVEGWVNYLKATCILVADDRVASNPLQCSILELAVPQGLKVFIGRVEEICAKARTAALDAERIILLFSNPADVLHAMKNGMDCRELTIGGMRTVPGKRRILDVLAVDDADVGALQELVGMGVKITIQTVPTQRPIPFDKVFDACHAGGKK